MNKKTAFLKSILFLILALQPFSSALVHAGAPLKMNFQGRLDESGQPAEGSKTFIFKLYDALAAGNLIWTSQS